MVRFLERRTDPCCFVVGGDDQRKGIAFTRGLTITAIHGRCPPSSGRCRGARWHNDGGLSRRAQRPDLRPTPRPAPGAQLTHSPLLGYSSLIVNARASFPPCHFSESGKEELTISMTNRFPA